VTPLGWIFMFLSVGFVVGLAVWCFYRVLRTHEKPEDQFEDFHSA
jgi:hypothetical protein